MRFRRENLIELFDDKDMAAGHIDGLAAAKARGATLGSHISALAAMMGEDLIIGTFLHYYLNSREGKANVISYDCKCAAPSRSKLDAWIEASDEQNRKILYQCEVKNWSGHSLPKYKLPADSDRKRVVARAEKNWHSWIVSENHRGKIEKVTRLTVRPAGFESEVRALICFWAPIKWPEHKLEPFFEFDCRTHWLGAGHLKSVYFFSASLYLRALKEDFVEMDLPRFRVREELLKNMLQ